MSKAVGIDLGTLNSCIGIWDKSKAIIIPSNFGNYIIPSMVSFNENETLIGQSAKNKLIKNYMNTITNSKRLIGRKYEDKEVQEDIKNLHYKIEEDEETGNPIIILDHKKKIEKIFPEYVSSLILNYLKQMSEGFTKSKIEDAVITVPANFNENQRQSTIEAAENAGLNVLRIINEPTAAAITYALQHKDIKKKNILIFDLGAGTFDVSVVEIKDGIIVVKSTCGNSHLGGEDFDNEIKKICISKFKNENNIDITNDLRANVRLKIACEEAKERLTNEFETTIDISNLGDNKNFNFQINRVDFEEYCNELFNKLMPIVNEAILNAKLNKNEIDDIVLVGGGTRMPKVREILSKNFGEEKVKILQNINPDEAVAYGASYLAYLIMEGITDDKVILVDVIGISIGMEIYSNKMKIIIPKNTTIPISKKIRVETTYDNQTSLCVNIYQGENVENIYKNNFLKSIYIDNIINAKAGEIKFDITFIIDVNSTLNIKVENLDTGEITFHDLSNQYNKFDEINYL